jgi:circadian clock protein KaiC
MVTDHSVADEAGSLAASGIQGLDEILRGGFPREDMHLVLGAAGTGKTTVGLEFLLSGADAGESGLYVTLSQTRDRLERIARSHGWSLDAIAVHELLPGTMVESQAERQTVLHTAEVELDELTRALRERVEKENPRRVVFVRPV